VLRAFELRSTVVDGDDHPPRRASEAELNRDDPEAVR